MKTWMKRTAFLSASISLLSITPAYAQWTSLATLEEAKTAYENLSDVDLTYNLDAKEAHQNYDLESEMDMSVKAVQKNSPSNLKLYMDVSMSSLGSRIYYNTYYENGYSYVDWMGTKTRSAVSSGEAQSQVASFTNLMYTDEEWYDRIVYWEKDGNKIVTFDLADDKLQETAEPLIEMLMINQEGREVTVNEVTGEYVMDSQGNPSQITIAAEMNMVRETDVYTLNMNAQLQLYNPGQPVELPAVNMEEYSV